MVNLWKDQTYDGGCNQRKTQKQTVGQLSIFDYRMASEEPAAARLPQQLEICQILELWQRIKVEQIRKFPQKDNTRRFAGNGA